MKIRKEILGLLPRPGKLNKNVPNKLECLYLAGLFSLVSCSWVYPEAYLE
jgi:hypothetical protein